MLEPNVFSTPVDFRFRDLDAMGHVNNAVFFTYFEQGRLDFFNSASSENTFPGFDFILAHISCDYLKPVTIDDQLVLQMRVAISAARALPLTTRFSTETTQML